MPTKQSEDAEHSGYWRVSTLSKENIDLAVAAKQWGTSRGLGMKTIKPGDRIVFYVSRGHDAGYWGTASVASEVFVSRSPVWIDDIYPSRIRLASDASLRSLPVKSDAVTMRLGGRRLKYLSRVGVIPLTPVEYQAIAALLMEVGDKQPGEVKQH